MSENERKWAKIIIPISVNYINKEQTKYERRVREKEQKNK